MNIEPGELQIVNPSTTKPAGIGFCKDISGNLWFDTGNDISALSERNYTTLQAAQTDAAAGLIAANTTIQIGGAIYTWDGVNLIPVGGITVSGLSTAQTSAAAAANTSAIQSALNQGGIVSIRPVTGSLYTTYYVSGTLYIPSFTKLDLSGVELAHFNTGSQTSFLAFANANYNAPLNTLISITGQRQVDLLDSANYITLMTLNYASTPDVAPGNYVLVKGDYTNFSNGIWLVNSVDTVNNLVTFTHGEGSPHPSMPIPVSTATTQAAANSVTTSTSSTSVTGTGFNAANVGMYLFDNAGNKLGQIITVNSTTSLTLFANASENYSGTYTIGAYSGTISTSSASTTVTGTGTNFNVTHIGLFLFNSSGVALGQIKSVASATSLTLTANASATYNSYYSMGVYNCTPIISSSVTINTTSGSQTVTGTGFTSALINQFICTSSGIRLGIVTTINSGTNLTISASSPISYSGTAYLQMFSNVITANKADAYCSIVGTGRINKKYFDQKFTFADTIADHGVIFNNVLKPYIGDGIEIYNCRKYAVTLANTQDSICKDVTLQTLSDGLHHYGPQFGLPNVQRIHGTTGDDGVIFHTTEDAEYPNYAFMPPNAGGSFYRGVAVRDVNINIASFSSQVVIYACGSCIPNVNQSFGMYGIYSFDNIGSAIQQKLADYGEPSTSATFSYSSLGSSSFIENIIVKAAVGLLQLGGLTASGSSGVTTTVGLLDVENFYPGNLPNSNPITISGSIISKAVFDDANFKALTVIMNCITIDQTSGFASTINQLIIDSPLVDGSISSGGANLLVGNSTTAISTINQIIVDNPILLGTSYILNGYPVSTGTLQMAIKDPLSSNYLIANSNNQNANITIDRANLSNPVLNQYGGSANLTLNINDSILNNGLVSLYGGSGTLNINCLNIGITGGAFVNPNSAGTNTVNITANDVNFSGGANFASTLGFNTFFIKSASNGSSKNRITTSPATVPNLNLYNRLIIAFSGSAFTINLPTTPMDGEVLNLSIIGTITALTFANGTVLGAPTSVTTYYTRLLTYSSSDTAWS